MMTVSSYGLTDTGRIREHNEDAFLVNDNLRLYGVADGLGGMKAGEVASQLALHELQQFVHSHSRATAAERDELMARAFSRINQHIIRVGGQREEHQGMSTTITACWLSDFGAHFVHAGDSAAFLLRGTKLKKISRDHTLLAAVSEGLVFAPRSRPRVWDHILTRCLGYRLDDKPDTMHIKLHAGDILLMCTDGLLRHVEPVEIPDVFKQSHNLSRAAQWLVNTANRKGGQDNITVVLVKIGDASK